MARPVKLGLDYFPTDTDILKNIKIRKLIRKYRELGFVLYLQLLTDIYRNSYFIELSDEYIFDLADQFHKRDKTILEMIDFMVKVDLFNKNLRNSLILTSPSIQKRYFAVKGNSYKGLEKDLLYILIPFSPEKPPVISGETPQRKGKKSKVEESRENLISSDSCLTRARENFETIEMKSPFIQEREQKRRELFADEEWLYSISMMSGKGHKILDLLPPVMHIFEMHLISIGDTGTILNINDYKRRFQNWWRCLNFASAKEIMEQNQKNKCSAPRTVQKTSKVEEAMAVAERASEMAYQLMQQNPL